MIAARGPTDPPKLSPSAVDRQIVGQALPTMQSGLGQSPTYGLDDRVRRYDNGIESTNLETRAPSPNPLGEADFGEVMPRKRKTTRTIETPTAKGVARKAGKRAGAKAIVARKPGAVPHGLTLRGSGGGIVVPEASGAGLGRWSGQTGTNCGTEGRFRLNRAGHLATISA